MNQHRPLLVYDGDCAFCTTWVQRLGGALAEFPEAQPWQWLDLAQFGLTEQDVARYAWLLSDGRRYRGHEVFAALLRRQPSRGLRLLGHLVAKPPLSWIARLGYFLIARYRHRLPGGTAACAMPKPMNRPV